MVQSGDRVVAAGGASQNETAIQALARYLPDGSLDSAFGAGGSTQILPGPVSRITDVVVDGSGRLVTAGFFLRYVPGRLEFFVVTVSRLSPDGVVDGGFGCAGSTLVDAPSEFGGSPAGLGITPDGRILVGGTALVGPNTESGRSPTLSWSASVPTPSRAPATGSSAPTVGSRHSASPAGAARCGACR